MTQLLLWTDVRIPDEYKQHYRVHNDCMLCGHQLRHHMHAYNHWLACHVVKVSLTDPDRYFIYKKGPARGWIEVSKTLFDACKRDGFAWAVVKPTGRAKTRVKRATVLQSAA